MAAALKTAGLRIRGYPDLGRLYVRRWDGRSVAGTIDAIERPRKFVDASFLGDLARNAKGREALLKVSLSGGVDEALEVIARHASLPDPLGEIERVPHPILGGRYRGIEVSFSMRARPPLRIDRETRRAARPQKK